MQTDSYRGIALSGLMPTLPAIVFRLAALRVSGDAFRLSRPVAIWRIACFEL
jgi:hypothetical protein